MQSRRVVSLLTVLAGGAAALLLAWPGWGAPPAPSPAGEGGSAAVIAAACSSALGPAATAAVSEDLDAAATRRAVVPDAPTTGELLAHVRFGDGTPIVGMLLAIWESTTDDEGKHWPERTAVTDGMGEARFAGLAPGRFQVETDARSRRLAHADVVAGQCAECTFELPRGRRVCGVVTDQHDQPVPSAEVVGARWGLGEHRTWTMARCDTAGRFDLQGIDGTMLLGARRQGLAPSPLRFVVMPHDAEQDVTLRLGGEPSAVSGVVTDAAGRPVAAALVAIGAAAGITRVKLPDGAPGVAAMPVILRTDADGCFAAADLPAGVATPVTVRSDGGFVWLGNVDLVAGHQAWLAARLVATAALAGTVTAGDGTPVADVEVRIVGTERPFLAWSCRTAADGSYRRAELPEVEVVVAAGRGEIGFQEARVQLRAGSVACGDLQLPRLRTVSGHVVDGVGRPIAGCRVDVAAAQGVRKVNTEPDGGFRVEKFAGDKLWLQVHSNGPGDAFAITRAFSGKELDGDLMVTLDNARRPSARLRGRAVAADGAPIAGATLSTHQPCGLGGTLLQPVAADGTFDLGPFPPGSITLRLSAPGRGCLVRSHQLLVEANVDLGDLRLLPAAQLDIVVTRSDGRPVVDADVRVVDGAGHFQELVECRAGSGSTSQLTAGTWVVTAAVPGCALASARVRLQPGEAGRVSIAVRDGVPCRLQLPGKPAEGEDRSLVLRGPDGLRQALWWNDQPQPQVAELCLRPGEYSLSRGDGGGRAFAFTVPASGPAEFVAAF